MKKVLMLHGINHKMFGKREPLQYGTVTLAEIDARLQALGDELGVTVESFQSNCEGAMCERIHAAYGEGFDAVLINAGAWIHYSYGIRDALAILTVPFVEIHMCGPKACRINEDIHRPQPAHIGQLRPSRESTGEQSHAGAVARPSRSCQGRTARCCQVPAPR